MEPKRHFAILDLYRFLAASLVFFYHFHAQVEQPSQQWMGRNLDSFVDFFFVLSGLVITYTYEDSVVSHAGFRIYLRRRFARLIPLHLLTLTLLVTLAALFPGLDDKHMVWAALPYQISLLQTFSPYELTWNYPSWSISVEWCIYFTLPILVWMRQRWGAIALIAVILVAAMGRRSLEGGAEFSVLRAIPTFVAGAMLALYRDNLRLRHGTAIGAGLFVFAVVLVLLHAHRYLIAVTFVATVAATVGDTTNNDAAPRHALVQTLGDASYSIYLLHVPLMLVCFDLIWRRGLGLGPVPAIFVVPTWLVLIILAILTFRHFERPAKLLLSGPGLARPPIPSSHGTLRRDVGDPSTPNHM